MCLGLSLGTMLNKTNLKSLRQCIYDYKKTLNQVAQYLENYIIMFQTFPSELQLLHLLMSAFMI